MAPTTSAADRHDVGWPEPAAVVMRMEWMRKIRAFSRSCSKRADVFAAGPAEVMGSLLRAVSNEAHRTERSPIVPNQRRPRELFCQALPRVRVSERSLLRAGANDTVRENTWADHWR